MRRKYPWEEWLGRVRTVLLRGVHYRCSQSTMCQTIRNNASRRGLRVRLVDTGTEILVEVVGAGEHGEIPHTNKAAVAG